MSLSKERREQIRQWGALAPSSAPVEQYIKGDGGRLPLTCGELRALLDLADERDRYREAVKQAKTELWRCRSDMAIMFLDDDGGIPDEDDQRRLADIEQAALACSAALEGKTND